MRNDIKASKRRCHSYDERGKGDTPSGAEAYDSLNQ